MRNYRELSLKEVDNLERLFPVTTNRQLSRMFDISVDAIIDHFARPRGWRKDYKVVHQGNRKGRSLTPDEIDWIRANFASTRNEDILRRFNIGESQLHRVSRQYNLHKSREFMSQSQRANVIIAHKVCRDYGIFIEQGKQLQKRVREMRERGEIIPGSFSDPNYVHIKYRLPPEEYAEIIRRSSATRKEIIRKERLRMKWGLHQRTNLHLTIDGYTPRNRRVNSMRYRLGKIGYITERGSKTIWYEPDLQRHPAIEASAEKLGFVFECLTESTENTEIV